MSRVQGFLSGVPYLAMWLVSAGGSILVDFIISKQIVSTTVIRKIANTIATLGPALALLGANMLKILKNMKYIVLLTNLFPLQVPRLWETGQVWRCCC